MKKFFKQLVCRHEDILTITKTNLDSPMLIISSLIQCSKCEKTFAQHPNARCCYVYHLHNEIMQQKFIEQAKQGFPLYQHQQSNLRT